MVPEANLKELEESKHAGWSDDLKAYGNRVLRGVSNVVELLAETIEGECGRWWRDLLEYGCIPNMALFTHSDRPFL